MELPYLRAASPQTRQVTLEILLVALLSFMLGFGAVAWRIDRAPDVATDEIIFTRASLRVAGEGALIADSGSSFLTHPPLYFLAQSAYLNASAEPERATRHPGDIFGWVYHARLFNALLAGLTAAVLYWLGRQLHGPGLGLMLVVLFVVDPFSLRLNRGVVIETLAMLLVLTGLAVLVTARDRFSVEGAIVAGLLFGAAMLTREITVFVLPAILLFWLWERRHRRATGVASNALDRSMLLLLGIAALTYMAFPLWAVMTGLSDELLAEKILPWRQLFSRGQLENEGGAVAALVDTLVWRLTSYPTTTLVVALGLLATIWLLLVHRDDREARLLVCWSLVLYPVYGLTYLLGGTDERSFYFLAVPAMVVSAFAAAVFPERAGRFRTDAHSNTISAALYHDPLWRGRNLALGLVLTLVLSYNLVGWWMRYATGVDTGYSELVTYVEHNVPPWEPLNAGADSLRLKYFFPNRPITDAATPTESRLKGVQYFVVASADDQSWRLDAELASWLRSNGEELFAAYGDSYGEITLYRAGNQIGSAVGLQGGDLPQPFAAAQTGFVAGFLLLIGFWLALIGLGLLFYQLISGSEEAQST